MLGTLVDLIRLEGLVKLEIDCYLSNFSLARLSSHSPFLLLLSMLSLIFFFALNQEKSLLSFGINFFFS